MAKAPLQKLVVAFQVPGGKPCGAALCLWSRGDPAALTLPQFRELMDLTLDAAYAELRHNGQNPVLAELVKLELQADLEAIEDV